MKKQNYGAETHRPIFANVLSRGGHRSRAAQAKNNGRSHWDTHVKKQIWIGFTEALDDYVAKRGNGDARDNPKNAAGETIDFPVGGNFDDWKNPKDGFWYIRYTEGPNDKAWMEERDLNYILRLEREGRLLDVEPNADKEIATWLWQRSHLFEKEIKQALERARAGKPAPIIPLASTGTTSTAGPADDKQAQQAESKAKEQAEKARLEAERKAKAEKEQQERTRQEQLRLEEQRRKAEEKKQQQAAERLAEQQRSKAEAKRVAEQKQREAEQQRLLQEQRAKLTTNLQDLQIEPAKLQGLLQKVSALPTTAGYELADIQHLTAITGRLSQELAAQQTAITAVEHEVGLDPVTRAELDCIRANKNLSGFYQMLRKTLSDAVVAAKSISSGWGEISDDKLDDVLKGAEVIGEQFPGIALVVKVLTKSAKLAYKQHKKTMMGHLAEVSPDVTSFERAAELFARQLTMENKEWLSRYDELGEQGLWARMQKVKEQISDACREFIGQRKLSRTEKLAIETGTVVLALIMGGEMAAWRDSGEFARQLLCLWQGEGYVYKSPIDVAVATAGRIAESVVVTAGAAAGGGSYGQVGAALQQRTPSSINPADREEVEELRRALEEQKRLAAEEKRMAAEERKRMQEMQEQMRLMMEQTANAAKAASRDASQAKKKLTELEAAIDQEAGGSDKEKRQKQIGKGLFGKGQQEHSLGVDRALNEHDLRLRQLEARAAAAEESAKDVVDPTQRAALLESAEAMRVRLTKEAEQKAIMGDDSPAPR